MTTDQFRATLRQQPFRPFTIRMADGRAFDVPHPDFVAQSPSGRTVIEFQSEENYSVLDLLLMSELQISSPGGNSKCAGTFEWHRARLHSQRIISPV